MGLLDKAKSYREKLILESLKGESDFLYRKKITIEDLKIIKEYYEKSLSSSVSAPKFGLLGLLVKVAEDVKYFSSVEAIVSSFYTVLSRVGCDVEGIGYVSNKLDVIYGEMDENEIPTFIGMNYYYASNGKMFFRIVGEMGTFLVAKCRGEVKFDEDTEMIVKKCIDILSISLRLVQFKSMDIQRFWGYRNNFVMSQIYSIVGSEYGNDRDGVVMLAYYLKELFGLNFVIFFSEVGETLRPVMAFDFPIDVLSSLKVSSDVFGKNINGFEVVDLELSKLFSYGSQNIAFFKIRGYPVCVGANYDLSFVISMASSM